MAQTPLSDADLKKLIGELKKRDGSIPQLSKDLNIPYETLRSRLRVAKLRGFKIPENNTPLVRPGDLSDEELQSTWNLYERYGYAMEDAWEASGLGSMSAFKNRIIKAQRKLGLQKRDLGRTAAAAPKIDALPKKGKVRRIVFTCAQNNTRPHMPTWRTLTEALAPHYGAEIVISTFTYIRREGDNAKRRKGEHQDDIWWAPEFAPYINDEYLEVAPGLAWHGHINTLPTKAAPLSGYESYGGRRSGIFPHAKIAMESIATAKSDATKFNFTTAAVTLPNYIQRTAGQKAEFHHAQGGLLVEINEEGNWWCRQLNADSDGTIRDLDMVFKADGTAKKHDGVEAIVFGDIHVSNIDEEVKEATWGKGGLVDALSPRHQVFHDILDFESRSHHNRRDPHKMFSLWVQGRDSVMGEIRGVANFLCETARAGCRSVVVNSNHDRHLERWLKEADWRQDLPNAEFYIDAQKAMLSAIRADKPFDGLGWALGAFETPKGLKMLGVDESFIVCKTPGSVKGGGGGGVELGFHGDIGPNGARGSAKNLSKIGRKLVIGHSHSARIVDGVYQVGVTGQRDMGYNHGPGSWSATHCIVHRGSGKRQLVTIWRGQWRAKSTKSGLRYKKVLPKR